MKITLVRTTKKNDLRLSLKTFEQLLQQILNSQQSSANAVSQLTSTLQAAQVGMGVQTKPAENRADMATAHIINPMFGKDVN